jgi:CRISPR-associated protein Cmr5
MNKIEKLLPSALDAATKYITTDDDHLSVPKQFKGYISSFGASVIQSGLMPTLAFYGDAGKAKGDRSMLIPALIFILIEKERFPENKELKSWIDKIKEEPKELPNLIQHLFGWLMNTDKENHDKLRKELMDASIALKLALRTFREVDTDKKKKP